MPFKFPLSKLFAIRILFCLGLSTLPASAENHAMENLVLDKTTPGSVYFTPPPGWHLGDRNSLSQSVEIVVVGKGSKAYPPSINLATEVFQGSLKDYLKIVKAINAAKGYEWKDLGKIQTEAGEGSLSQLDKESEWGDVRMLHTILKRNGTIYIMTAAALREEFPSFYKQFFDAMRSLHIND